MRHSYTAFVRRRQGQPAVTAWRYQVFRWLLRRQHGHMAICPSISVQPGSIRRHWSRSSALPNVSNAVGLSLCIGYGALPVGSITKGPIKGQRNISIRCTTLPVLTHNDSQCGPLRYIVRSAKAERKDSCGIVMATPPKSGQKMDFIELKVCRNGILPTAIILNLARGGKI